MFLTDYLVICGRAFACSMYSARATLESPFDSSKAHHRSTHLPCATLLGAGARYRHLLSTNLGSERKGDFNTHPAVLRGWGSFKKFPRP
jgi:hypothetical protein